jgi:hypothetical protein
MRFMPKVIYDALPVAGCAAEPGAAPLAASLSAEGASGLFAPLLASGTGAVLGRMGSTSKLTVLPPAVFGRRVILFLSACSEMRLSSLTNDSPHQALGIVSSCFASKLASPYLVYLLMYLLSFW